MLAPDVCLHTYIWVGEAEKGFPWHCSLRRLVYCRDQPYPKEAQFSETRRRILPLECINRTVSGTTASLRQHEPGQKRFELRMSQNTVKLPGQPAGYKGKTDPGPLFHRTWQPPEVVKHSSLLSPSLHFFICTSCTNSRFGHGALLENRYCVLLQLLSASPDGPVMNWSFSLMISEELECQDRQTSPPIGSNFLSSFSFYWFTCGSVEQPGRHTPLSIPSSFR